MNIVIILITSMEDFAGFIVSCIYYHMVREKSGKNTSKRTVTSSQQVKKSVRSHKEASPPSSPQSSPPACHGMTSLLSFLIFVCPPPHLHHLPTPSDLIHLPSAASAPTPRCTCATMLHPHLD